MILDIIAEDKALITYRPKLNQITSSITATILLQQILYWWKKNGSKEFYKFKAPCKHSNYAEGDSWIEELGMTIYEFDSAYKKLKKLGIVSSRNTVDRKTYYSIDEAVLTARTSEVYLNGKNQDRKMGKTDSAKWEKPIQLNGKNQDSITISETNKETNTEKERAFDKFWELYEKKGNKKTSKRRFLKLKQEDIDNIFKHVPEYIKACPEIQFRKNAETYLNNECWNDTIIPAKANNKIFNSQKSYPTSYDEVVEV